MKANQTRAQQVQEALTLIGRLFVEEMDAGCEGANWHARYLQEQKEKEHATRVIDNLSQKITLPAGKAVELSPFVQMPKPTPLPELEVDPYERIHDTLYIVARRMAILAMFVFICLLYFR